MGKQREVNHLSGVTLFELLAVVMLISIVTFIAINMFNSVKARGQLSDTHERLDLVVAKIKQYYEIHEQLPEPIDPDGAGPEPANELPVQPDALDMEQKYRLDAWGHYLRYYRASSIVGFEVNSQSNVAGVLISLGANQTQDYIMVPGTPTVFRDGPPPGSGDLRADDLLIPIIVTAEAKLITLRKLKVLQEKVDAYDALFAGIDNDGDGTVDNILSTGDAVELTGTPPALDYNTCPPTNSFANDPSEGISTLDAIETGSGDYNCPGPLIDLMVDFYDLPNTFPTDSWNQPFQWGYEGRALEDGSLVEPMNSRYHRFYSTGPSGPDPGNTDILDDIVFLGK